VTQNLSQPLGNHRSLTSRVASAAGRLRSDGQSESNLTTYPKTRLRSDYFRVADQPEAIRLNHLERLVLWKICSISQELY